MTNKEVQEKTFVMSELISGLITEELGEDITHEVLREIESLASSAVQVLAQEGSGSEEEQGLIEYFGDMDNFASED